MGTETWCDLGGYSKLAPDGFFIGKSEKKIVDDDPGYPHDLGNLHMLEVIIYNCQGFMNNRWNNMVVIGFCYDGSMSIRPLLHRRMNIRVFLDSLKLRTLQQFNTALEKWHD